MNTATPARTATAANVRAEMARAGVNQTVVASWLGIAQSAVSARLRGAVPFDIDELATLSERLGVPITVLIASPFPAGRVTSSLNPEYGGTSTITRDDLELAA